MSAGRDAVLGPLRRALGRAGNAESARAAMERRLTAHERGLIPDRAQKSHAAQVELFTAMAEEVAASVERVGAMTDVPAAVARFMTAHNLPARLRQAPDAALDALPWKETLIEVTRGRAEPEDQVSLTGAFAGIAETGTLMLLSGPAAPTTLNFLPDNHVVVLKASQITGAYEDAWDRLRAARSDGDLPRTVNFITGPSRTADIEQTIQLGAHGPRRLHIVLVEDEEFERGPAPA